MLDGEEDKAMWILLKEWLGGKMALYFSFFVTRYFFGRRRTFGGFPCDMIAWRDTQVFRQRCFVCTVGKTKMLLCFVIPSKTLKCFRAHIIWLILMGHDRMPWDSGVKIMLFCRHSWQDKHALPCFMLPSKHWNASTLSDFLIGFGWWKMEECERKNNESPKAGGYRLLFFSSLCRNVVCTFCTSKLL